MKRLTAAQVDRLYNNAGEQIRKDVYSLAAFHRLVTLIEDVHGAPLEQPTSMELVSIPLKPQQRVAIADLCTDLGLAFKDDWLGDVGTVIDMVEVAHKIKPMPGDAERSHQDLLLAAVQLVREATSLKQVITIERRALKPLAMGHAEYVISTRELSVMAGKAPT